MELHCDNAKRVASTLPSANTKECLAGFYKSFSDATRLGILFCMMEGEICVHDISNLLDMSQPRVSNHLRLLKQDGLVSTRREGNQIFYRLNDEHIHDVLAIGLEHVAHTNKEEE